MPSQPGNDVAIGAANSGLQIDAEFRRIPRDAGSKAGAELVRLARQVGLVKGDWVAIDGSKFGAVSSEQAVREREAVKRYLDQVEATDGQDEVVIDPAAVAAARKKLRNDPEPEARLMLTEHRIPLPAYNVQTAVDAEHGLIVAQQGTTEPADNRSLLPMVEAAKQAVGAPETLHVAADAGYSNGEQAAQGEAQGIVPHVPANRREPPRRWHAVRPQLVHIRGKVRHVPLSSTDSRGCFVNNSPAKSVASCTPPRPRCVAHAR